jgi:uncharacterized membrane protein YedE/YeeE
MEGSQVSLWTALAGGVVIGLAVASFVLLNGRILGISGIVGGLLRPTRDDWAWRLSFLLGLLAAPIVWTALLPDRWQGMPQISASAPMIVVAGLLVGFGTRSAAGCTSGHGVCGLARLSPRSIVATVTFMLSGMVTVYLIRHLLERGP